MPKTVTVKADVLPALAEIFREHGFEGASLSLIAGATGLGKGSLYHFFPGGKEEMAAFVLDDIDKWFRANIFSVLRDAADPKFAIEETLKKISTYFRSGGRVCLLGAFALGNIRDRFAVQLRGYFAEWENSLTYALVRNGHKRARAVERAEDAIASIQGAIVLSRALDDLDVFSRALQRISSRLLAP
tara:strand:+ start:811 stop:1371 length:561 start_codon:yes stop_codon:yes gene_type:complete